MLTYINIFKVVLSIDIYYIKFICYSFSKFIIFIFTVSKYGRCTM